MSLVELLQNIIEDECLYANVKEVEEGIIISCRDIGDDYGSYVPFIESEICEFLEDELGLEEIGSIELYKKYRLQHTKDWIVIYEKCDITVCEIDGCKICDGCLEC